MNHMGQSIFIVTQGHDVANTSVAVVTSEDRDPRPDIDEWAKRHRTRPLKRYARERVSELGVYRARSLKEHLEHKGWTVTSDLQMINVP